MLVNGVWEKKWDPVQKQDKQGRFIRQSSAFRESIPSNVVNLMASGEYATPRFHLYVGYICPWATRTLIARSLLGLEQHISVSVVEPQLTDEGWQFGGYPGSTPETDESVKFIHQLYTQTDPAYTGRATVPVLWDKQEQRILNNESADILRIFNNDLKPLHRFEIDLSPAEQSPEIDTFNARIYDSVNNGVYRTGFATSQQAYEEAYTEVFEALDGLESHFARHPFAVGEHLTESDIRLFVTLVRFDVAYYGLFKTNKKRISDYPELSAYLERLLQIPAFRNNTRIDHIKAGYYSIQALNPTGIVPAGPELPWFKWFKEDL